MIKLLLKLFVRDSDNTTDAKVRERYGVLGGVLGIICNLLLFGVKLGVGTIMNSIAITSDAFNNLSDLGSSVISVIGSKLSNRRADREHPFGHGRFEYISSLIVSFIIMLMGFELMKSSFDKLIHPETVDFSAIPIIVLSLSMLVKVWMFSYNRYLGKRISSGILLAASADSLSDVIATGAVILATIAGSFTSLPIDGAAGIAVSLLIMKTGFSIAKETVGLLLGSSPDAELVDKINEEIMAGECVIGVHDLIVHDYGPGRTMASAHAEVPDTSDIVAVHEIMDAIEEKVLADTGIMLVLHTDPVSVNCEKTRELKAFSKKSLAEINEEYSLHDFRITSGENRINVIFDLVLPPELTVAQREETAERLRKAIEDSDSRLFVHIKIDTAYSSEKRGKR